MSLTEGFCYPVLEEYANYELKSPNRSSFSSSDKLSSRGAPLTSTGGGLENV